MNSLRVKWDSELVINQVQGKYRTKDEKMKKYLTIVNIKNFSIKTIPRKEKQLVDSLSELDVGGAKNKGTRFVEESPYSVTHEARTV